MTKESSIKRITFAVSLVASSNLAWAFYQLWVESARREQLYEETGLIVCSFGPPLQFVARFHIEIFLLLALIGSRSKGLNNTLLTVVGLSGAVLSYMLWWQSIFRWARNAEVSVNAIPNFAYLVGGNLLDLVIAGAIGLLVLMNVSRDARASFRLGEDASF